MDTYEREELEETGGETVRNAPEWVLPRGQIDEVAFARKFLELRNLICLEGAFFSRYGRIADEDSLRREIYIFLSDHIRTGLPGKVERCLATMRMASYRESLPYEEDAIHVWNGVVHLDGDFEPKVDFCRYRLPVRYDPINFRPPERWLAFLDQLLEPEDILTLQEYMGYCLIPTTRGQKMLIITGRGGEGKSRIGVVMKALLGCNMGVGSVAKLESSPFARADLQHLLVLVDDDLKMEALSQTNNIKAIVTAELPMDLERKGIQSYQGLLHARLMAFGNGSLRSLHDRSYGFFRRQIILTAKPRDPGRKDDPFLAEKLLEEKEGIFLWCLEGLQRLRKNGFRFTLSGQAKRNLMESLTEGNNVIAFLRSQGYFTLTPEATATSKALCECYRSWCADNSFHPLSDNSFLAAFREQAQERGIQHSNHIPIGNGKQARGFTGIRICSRF